jgi:hypothetical protein
MPTPAHRALRIILAVMSLLIAAGGLLMIFGNRALMVRLFLGPSESEFSTLLLAMLKEMGGMLLLLSFLLYRASRDPVRNVAILDGLIVGVCVLAVTPLLSLYMLDLGQLYPASLIWGRSLLRLAVAGLLLYLRPRGAGAIPN